MGRDETRRSELPDEPTKVRLERVRINSQGYDPGGAYWGTGEPLWVAHNADAYVELFTRAPDRSAAKARIAERFPLARFYR